MGGNTEFLKTILKKDGCNLKLSGACSDAVNDLMSEVVYGQILCLFTYSMIRYFQIIPNFTLLVLLILPYFVKGVLGYHVYSPQIRVLNKYYFRVDAKLEYNYNFKSYRKVFYFFQMWEDY